MTFTRLSGAAFFLDISGRTDGLDGNGGYECHELGWKLLDNRFVPLMSRINAVPDSLVKVIRFNCSTACKTPRLLIQKIWTAMYYCQWTMPT